MAKRKPTAKKKLRPKSRKNKVFKSSIVKAFAGLAILIAMVAIAGFANGTMICQNIWKFEQPSIRAASSRSSGMVLKNCRNRKMLKTPPPKKEGMMSGYQVLTQPIFSNNK